MSSPGPAPATMVMEETWPLALVARSAPSGAPVVERNASKDLLSEACARTTTVQISPARRRAGQVEEMMEKAETSGPESAGVPMGPEVPAPKFVRSRAILRA